MPGGDKRYRGIIEGVGEQEVRRAAPIDEDAPNVEICNAGGDDEGVLVWEVHTPGIFGAERDWYLGVARRAGEGVRCEVVNLSGICAALSF